MFITHKAPSNKDIVLFISRVQEILWYFLPRSPDHLAN